MESVDDLDEAKVLGYLETIRSTFVTKVLLLGAHSELRGGKLRFRASSFNTDLVMQAKVMFPGEVTYFKCLAAETPELHANALDDLVTSLLAGGWAVFEHVLKHLLQPNYSQRAGKASLNYCNNVYGFSGREKKDLALFEYIRDAFQHHNGAYHAFRAIDHTYNGVRFQSAGNEGKKIDMTIPMAYKMILDLEALVEKAWKHASGKPSFTTGGKN